MPLRPDSGYAWTKYYAEQQILNAVADSRFEAIIVRAFKHSGPGQSSRMMLSEWARQFAENVSPVRVQSLESYVDLTDVRDVVRAYHALAEIDRPAAIYNLGSGLRRRTGDILTALQLLADPQRDLRHRCGSAGRTDRQHRATSRRHRVGAANSAGTNTR